MRLSKVINMRVIFVVLTILFSGIIYTLMGIVYTKSNELRMSIFQIVNFQLNISMLLSIPAGFILSAYVFEMVGKNAASRISLLTLFIGALGFFCQAGLYTVLLGKLCTIVIYLFVVVFHAIILKMWYQLFFAPDVYIEDSKDTNQNWQ